MAKILIVDDEEEILFMLSTLFETEGHEVQTSQRGDEAMEIIGASDDIDVIISDLRMNPVNGMELLKFTKRIRPSMPFILVTAFHTAGLAEDAKKKGAYHYMRKPFDMDELVSTVNQALESDAS
jgi:ATP-dependent Lon protease